MWPRLSGSGGQGMSGHHHSHQPGRKSALILRRLGQGKDGGSQGRGVTRACDRGHLLITAGGTGINMGVTLRPGPVRHRGCAHLMHNSQTGH